MILNFKYTRLKVIDIVGVCCRLLKYRCYCRWFKRKVYNNRGKGGTHGDSHYGEQGLFKTAGR